MTNRLDTVIFDFDGVLFDTEEINYQANEEAFARVGLSFSREDYARLWIQEGLDLEDIVKKFELDITPNALRKAKNTAFEDIVRQSELEPMIGVLDSVEQLKRAQFKLAIASSNLRKNIEQIFKKVGIESLFEVVVGREDISQPKPAPEVFQKTLSDIGSKAETSVVVEDAPKGVDSARRARIFNVIAIPNEWTRNGDFSNASVILPSAHNLPAVISQLS